MHHLHSLNTALIETQTDILSRDPEIRVNGDKRVEWRYIESRCTYKALRVNLPHPRNTEYTQFSDSIHLLHTNAMYTQDMFRPNQQISNIEWQTAVKMYSRRPLRATIPYHLRGDLFSIVKFIFVEVFHYLMKRRLYKLNAGLCEVGLR